MTMKAARVNRGLNQQEAAKIIGVSRTTLQSWETYKSYPTVAQLPAIEAAYGLKYDDIIFLPSDYALSVKTTESEGK
ncbi:MAG: helix-turn-helix transcriptional regulator [Ruminococcus sp.]|nr:helix-turn-helix transcriptional regulator [Ruminococcus sp.]